MHISLQCMSLARSMFVMQLRGAQCLENILQELLWSVYTGFMWKYTFTRLKKMDNSTDNSSTEKTNFWFFLS